MSVKTRQSLPSLQATVIGLPSPAALAALRAWYEGLSARDAVVRYLGDKKANGQSSRSMISKIRRQLTAIAKRSHRLDRLRSSTTPFLNVRSMRGQ